MASSTDTTDDILKCPICLEVYNKPKYLPCLHTFCEPCLKSYIVSSVKQNDSNEKTKVEFNCPICRVVVPVADPSSPPQEWASQFSNNHLIMTLLDRQKLESNVKLCDPCQVDNNDVTAVSWCKICNEALCEFCAKFHRKMVATKQHKLFLIAEQEKSSFDITRHEYCETHKDKQLEAFCFEHNEACCVTCLTLNHRKCENVTTLEDAAKDVRDKPEIKHLCDRLFETEAVLSVLLKTEKENLDYFKEQKLNLLNQVSERRLEINKCLDDTETKVTQEINNLDKQYTTERKDVVFALENQQKSIMEFHKVFDTCVNQATDTHVFLEMKRLENKQKEMDSYLKSSLKTIKKIHCKLVDTSPDIDKQLLAIGCFGTVDVQRNDITDEVLSSLEVPQLLRVLQKGNVFSKSCSFQVPGANIKDAVFLPDGKIAITSADEIHFCENDGNYRICMGISGASQFYGMKIFSENEVLVARPSGPYIHVVNFRKQKDIKAINPLKRCKGIEFLRGNIIGACGSELLFMDSNGTIMKEVDVETGVDNIASADQKLYYTNSITSTLYSITFEGSMVFEYKHPELKKPCGVTTDEEGFIFVAGYDSSNVHRVSPEGEHVKIILTEKDGIKNPHAICYDKSSNKLLVSHSNCKVEIYERTW